MADEARVVYEIVANEVLPVFDPLIKVKQILFSERQKLAFNALLWRYKKHIIPSYLFGHCLRIAAVFTPAEIGRWFALVSSLLQCPAGASMGCRLADTAVHGLSLPSEAAERELGVLRRRSDNVCDVNASSATTTSIWVATRKIVFKVCQETSDHLKNACHAVHEDPHHL